MNRSSSPQVEQVELRVVTDRELVETLAVGFGLGVVSGLTSVAIWRSIYRRVADRS